MRSGVTTVLEIIIALVLLIVMVKCGSVKPAHPYFNLPTPSATGGK